MSKYACSKTDCTVAVTEKCLLSHVPVETCPHVRVSQADVPDQRPEGPGSAFPTTLVYPGNELGLKQVSELFASRYGHLIGVLGAYGTGKTCLLCSLYLLASCGDLRPTRLFAGSMTLLGFESRLRLLRKWGGTGLPDKIVDHTSLLDDPRQPGFVHLALKQTAPVPALRDLFFTDLPGEWTTDLIKRADVAERFRFLSRADGLVITVQAPQLLAPETRNSQIQSARILLQRLHDAVGIAPTIPVIFAITRCDITGAIVPPAVYQVVEFARELGFCNVSHMPVASFSDRADVPSGMGVASLLDALFPTSVQSPPHSMSPSDESRMFARFRFVAEAHV
jgi:hypothetical protein